MSKNNPNASRQKPAISYAGYPSWLPVARSLRGALARANDLGATHYRITYRKFMDGPGRYRGETYPLRHLVEPEQVPCEVHLLGAGGDRLTGAVYIDPAWPTAKETVVPLALGDYTARFDTFYRSLYRQQGERPVDESPGRGIRTLAKDLRDLVDRLQGKWRSAQQSLGPESPALRFFDDVMGLGADLDALEQLAVEIDQKSVVISGALHKRKG